MDKDKRKGDKPIPDNFEDQLDELQLLALRRIEGFGWKLRFVRRPLFQDVVPIVFSAEGDTIGVLEEDGRINMQPDIEVREL